MTTTNTDLIRDALILINVLEKSESPDPDQGALGLRRLNQMMAEWDEDGIDLGYFAQDTQSDETPIPESAERAVTYNLAINIAPLEGATASQEVIAIAAAGKQRLDNQTAETIESDMSHLPQGEASRPPGTDLF